MVRVLLLLLALSLAACASGPTSRNSMEIANPASVHCRQVGGELRIESLGSRGEIGVCYFEDARQCEEWALFRDECPVGGRRVKGLVSEAARYCVIRGGRYEKTRGETATQAEQGRCTLPDEKVCDAASFWLGTCV